MNKNCPSCRVPLKRADVEFTIDESVVTSYYPSHDPTVNLHCRWCREARVIIYAISHLSPQQALYIVRLPTFHPVWDEYRRTGYTEHMKGRRVATKTLVLHWREWGGAYVAAARLACGSGSGEWTAEPSFATRG